MYFPLLVCLPGDTDMNLATVTESVTERLAPYDFDRRFDHPRRFYETPAPWHYGQLRMLRDAKALAPWQIDSRTLTWGDVLAAERRFDPVGSSLGDRLRLDKHGRAYRFTTANPTGYFGFWGIGETLDHPQFHLRSGATALAACPPQCARRHPQRADIAAISDIDLERNSTSIIREIVAVFHDAIEKVAGLPIAEPLSAILNRHPADGHGFDAAVAEYLAQPARRALTGHYMSALGDPIAILANGLDALLIDYTGRAALVGYELVDLNGVWQRSPTHELSEHPADRIARAEHRRGLIGYLTDLPADTVLVNAYYHR